MRASLPADWLAGQPRARRARPRASRAPPAPPGSGSGPAPTVPNAARACAPPHRSEARPAGAPAPEGPRSPPYPDHLRAAGGVAQDEFDAEVSGHLGELRSDAVRADGEHHALERWPGIAYPAGLRLGSVGRP